MGLDQLTAFLMRMQDDLALNELFLRLLLTLLLPMMWQEILQTWAMHSQWMGCCVSPVRTLAGSLIHNVSPQVSTTE